MAVSLAKEGIDVTVIPDSAIFAMMGRVNKVLLGCHAGNWFLFFVILVMADGSLIAVTGSKPMAIAAKHHSTPVVVCTGLFKLTPLHPHDSDAFNLFVSPNETHLASDGTKQDSLQPFYDYVEANLVNLFITNT